MYGLFISFVQATEYLAKTACINQVGVLMDTYRNMSVTRAHVVTKHHVLAESSIFYPYRVLCGKLC